MMFLHPEELGIVEISKEQYLKECARGLQIHSIASIGSCNLANPANEDLLLVSMSEKGKDEPHVSYSKLGNSWIFTKGYPWVQTPLRYKQDE